MYFIYNFNISSLFYFLSLCLFEVYIYSLILNNDVNINRKKNQ